jgi:hypothetical protein
LGHIARSSFPEDVTFVDLFMDTVSINYLNLVEIIRAVLDKIAILFRGLFDVPLV